jgi:hypothetical protein
LAYIPWKIYTACPNDKNFQLSEKNIQEILRIGKNIASKDKNMPFKLILEYEGWDVGGLPYTYSSISRDIISDVYKPTTSLPLLSLVLT